MRRVLEHSTTGKRQRERSLLSMEIRRKRITLLDVFNFFLGGGTERKQLYSSQRYKRTAPKMILIRDKRTLFFLRKMLDPQRQPWDLHSHGSS